MANKRLVWFQDWVCVSNKSNIIIFIPKISHDYNVAIENVLWQVTVIFYQQLRKVWEYCINFMGSIFSIIQYWILLELWERFIIILQNEMSALVESGISTLIHFQILHRHTSSSASAKRISASRCKVSRAACLVCSSFSCQNNQSPQL